MASEIIYIKQTSNEELKELNEYLGQLRDEGHFIQITWDTETTGFVNVDKTGKNANRMTEFGCKILMDNEPLKDKNGTDISGVQIYFNPWMDNPNLFQNKQAYEVHGIDRSFLEGKKTLGGNTNIKLEMPAQPIGEYIEELYSLLSENVLVSHNGRTFDVPFFNHELKHCEMEPLPKILIHFDTQAFFQKEMKKINAKFPKIKEDINWKSSNKLSVDGNPDMGVVPFLEKVSGEICPIERDKHGALLDSEILDWVSRKMGEVTYGKDNVVLFPEYRKAYKVIEEQIEKVQTAKEVKTEEDRVMGFADFSVQSVENEKLSSLSVDNRFYSDKTSIYAENPFYIGSCDIEAIFEKAESLGLESLTIMDHLRPNQNPIVRDMAKKYPDIQAKYGTTVRLKVGEDEFVLINLLVKSGSDYAELMDLTQLATKNSYLEPFLNLADLSGRGITKTVDSLKFEVKPVFSEAHNNFDTLDKGEVLSKDVVEDLLGAGFIFDIENKESLHLVESLNIPMSKTTLKSNVLYIDGMKKHELRVKSIMNLNGSKDIEITDLIKNKNLKTKREVFSEIAGHGNFDQAVLSKIGEAQRIDTDFVLPEHRDIMADYFVDSQYMDSFDEFIQRTNDGLEERFVANGITDSKTQEEYKERMKVEQDTILQMLEASRKAKSEGKTFDIIKFDEYLLGMSNKIHSVKTINNILEEERLKVIYSDQENDKILSDKNIRKLLVGTARGSAAGSLAAYCLYITEIDPMPYGLLFERFLNPERVTPPDIDTDFRGSININDLDNPKIHEQFPYLFDYMRSRAKTRYENNTVFDAKQFISEYYEWYRNTQNGRKMFDLNEEKTGGVLTLGFYKSKTTFSDVAKLYGDNYANLMGFASSVTLGDYLKSFVGDSVAETELSIKSVIDNSDEFTHIYNNNPLIRNLIDDAKLIEKSVKSEGIHAGAVVSEPAQIDGVKTTTIVYNKQGVPVCPFTMKNVEVMKDDILGLATLETIDRTVQLIAKGRNLSEEEYIDLSQKVRGLTSPKYGVVKEELEKCMEILVEGNNKGLFQIESDGMIDLFKKVFGASDNIDTYTNLLKLISILIALYRPGPMDSGMLDKYVSNVVENAEVEIPFGDKDLEELLFETSGVLVYQEQIMKMVQIVGDFTLGEADIIRRAMGKKDIKLMNEYGEKFVEGGLKKGYDKTQLEELYEDIKKFAGYGFNKSHSAAYAEVSLETLFLKANYPTYFAISTLNNKITQKADTFKPILNQVILEGNIVNKPDVFDYENYSIKFDIRTEGGVESINYGFEFILGENSATKIYELINQMDKNNPLSKEEFRKVLFEKLDKGAVEKLLKAGTLRIGDETLADVNEMYYTSKDKKGISQYQHVKDFLMKDKVVFAKGFESSFSKIYSTWKKETLNALMVDQDIRTNLTRLDVWDKFEAAMRGDDENVGMLDKIKKFPSTDFEIWSTEIGTICMENTVAHPLTSKSLHEVEVAKGVKHLDILLREIEEELELSKGKDLDMEKQVAPIIKTAGSGVVGVCSGLSRIKSKKGSDMLIGDIVTENNKRLTILVSGDSYHDIKIGKDIKNNEIVYIGGEVNYSEQYGLGIFAKSSEILSFTNIEETEETKEENSRKRREFQKKTSQTVQEQMIVKKEGEDKYGVDDIDKKLFLKGVNITKIKEIPEDRDIDCVLILKAFEIGQTQKGKPKVTLELTDGEESKKIAHYGQFKEDDLENALSLPIRLRLGKKEGNFMPSTVFKSHLVFVGPDALKEDLAKKENEIIEGVKKQIVNFVIKNDKDEDLVYRLKEDTTYELVSGEGVNKVLILSEKSTYEIKAKVKEITIKGAPSINKFDLNLKKELVSYNTMVSMEGFAIETKDGGGLTFKINNDLSTAEESVYTSGNINIKLSKEEVEAIKNMDLLVESEMRDVFVELGDGKTLKKTIQILEKF